MAFLTFDRQTSIFFNKFLNLLDMDYNEKDRNNTHCLEEISAEGNTRRMGKGNDKLSCSDCRWVWNVIGGEKKMKIEYDPTHDLLNIEFISEEPIAESVEYDGIVIDYSKDGKIVALEILDAGKRTTRSPLDLLDLTIVKEKVIV